MTGLGGTRKPNGRSSIYEDGDGRWHGWVTMGVKADGSLDRRHVRGSTQSQVTTKVRELEKQRDAGQVRKAGRVPTVAEWMATYLDTVAARTLAPKTLDDYWSKTNNWILPAIGRRRLDRLLPEHLDALYADMLRAGKAPSHVLKVHRIVSRALRVAVRRERVARNVAQLVDPPSAGYVEQQQLTRDEARAVLAAAAGRRNAARWSVGLACGLRQGEALGLRWEYVNLDTGDVRVWWQLQRNTWKHGCPDSHACGARLHRKPCPRNCAEHPAARVRARPAARPTRRPAHSGTAADWCSGGPRAAAGGRSCCRPNSSMRSGRTGRRRMPSGSTPAASGRTSTWCSPSGTAGRSTRAGTGPSGRSCLRAAGVRDVRVHDGRHTAGTLLIAQGVHIRAVQEILGHSDVRTTEGYTHVGSDVARDAAVRMGRALWGSDDD